MTRKQLNEVEKQLKAKRRAYNNCRSFAKRAKLDYEIGCLYEKMAEIYKNLKEN